AAVLLSTTAALILLNWKHDTPMRGFAIVGTVFSVLEVRDLRRSFRPRELLFSRHLRFMLGLVLLRADRAIGRSLAAAAAQREVAGAERAGLAHRAGGPGRGAALPPREAEPTPRVCRRRHAGHRRHVRPLHSGRRRSRRSANFPSSARDADRLSLSGPPQLRI